MPNVDAQRVRLQIERILARAAFTDAERASRFLRYMVERKLEGREAEIKESVVALRYWAETRHSIRKPIVSFERGGTPSGTGSVLIPRRKAARIRF